MTKPMGIFDGKPIHILLFYAKMKGGCYANNHLLKLNPGFGCHN